MSIRASFAAMAAMLVIVLGSILFLMNVLIENQRELEVSEDRRHESYKLAQQLRRSSDELTRMARTYVVTQDPRYQEWFGRILAIRNGEAPRPAGYEGSYWDVVAARGEEPEAEEEAVALEELMRRMDFSDAEFAMLREAQANSDALVALENRAMAAVEGRFDDGHGSFIVRGEPDVALARQLMHGEAYHREKGRIMEPIDEFLAMVEQRTTREMEAVRERTRELAAAAELLMFVAVAIVLLAIFVLTRSVIRPIGELAVAAHRVEEGDYTSRLSVRRDDEVGRLTGAFNLMSESIERDLVARERAAAELAEAREAAEAANRAKSAFLANMSHELRTPMNAVIGYSEMIAEEMSEEGDEDYLPDIQKIQIAGRHLLSLINDILDLSKIEAGRMDLYLERFDLRQMLDEATATVTPLVEKNQNALVTEFDEDLGSMRADLTKVRQSLFNLMSNAAKFTREGTVTLRARRVHEGETDRIRLSVVDTGVGIPPEKLDRVFEEFSQADESTTRNFGGTGLGLAISRRFCQMMGGDITVESRVGEGSTFTIDLPASVDALEAARTTATASGPIVEAVAVESRRSRGAQRPILVIDDDPQARDLLQRTLESDGYEVRTAENGEDGLRLAREINPSAITLDVMMPGMDGWEVLRRIKADADIRHIPVVLASMLHEKGLGFSLGAAEYLTKPVDRKLLLHLVGNYAGKTEDRGRVLVVEDDTPTRELVRRILEAEGWQVDEAGNGAEGLERVSEHAPDLVVLDLMMPVMDGFEFLRELRLREVGREIPVMVLTAKELDADEQRFLDEQVASVVEKGADSLETAMERVRSSVAACTKADAGDATAAEPGDGRT